MRSRWIAATGCLAGALLAQSCGHLQSSGTETDSAARGKARPPTTVLIMRHAEKLTDGESDLSTDGVERARLLAKAFSSAGQRADLPTPQVLFAAHISKHSDRSMQTITPLAQALHLAINDEFKDRDYSDLAAALLSGEYAGKTVLIVWHRGSIPPLAAALGATPPYDPWPVDQFDRIWRIDYTGGKATIRDLPLAMMPGDSK